MPPISFLIGILHGICRYFETTLSQFASLRTSQRTPPGAKHGTTFSVLALLEVTFTVFKSDSPVFPVVLESNSATNASSSSSEKSLCI